MRKMALTHMFLYQTKRIISILLTVGMMGSFTACGGIKVVEEIQERDDDSSYRMTTEEEMSTMDEAGDPIDEPNQHIDEGVNLPADIDEEEENTEAETEVAEEDLSGLPEWQRAYNDFLDNRTYLNSENSEVYDENTAEPISYALHDFESDGIPELLITNGNGSCYIYYFDIDSGVSYVGFEGTNLYYFNEVGSVMYNMSTNEDDIAEGRPVNSVFSITSGNLDGAGGETLNPDTSSMIKLEFVPWEEFAVKGWIEFCDLYKTSLRWDIPAFDDLETFLTQFNFTYWGTVYDCQHPDIDIVNSIINHPSMAYMYNNEECHMGWTGEEESDPRGYVDTWGGYFGISREYAKWVTTNIFNMDSAECDRLIDEAVKAAGEDFYEGVEKAYEEDGWIYSLAGGVGGPDLDHEFSSIERDSVREGNVFVIKYREVSTDLARSWQSSWYTVTVEYKEIDGEMYWTMYSFVTEEE